MSVAALNWLAVLDSILLSALLFALSLGIGSGVSLHMRRGNVGALNLSDWKGFLGASESVKVWVLIRLIVFGLGLNQ